MANNIFRKGYILGIIVLFIASMFSSTIADPGDNLPPVANAGGPYFGNVGENITFDGSGSWDPDGNIVAWNWIFGDGNIASGEIVNHTYTTYGNFTVFLTVTDDGGEGGPLTDKDTTFADINALPVADAGGPYYGNVGENITFDGSGSYDPDGIIVAWNWTFGDGNDTDEENPIHTYAEPGNYTVTLTVYDDSAPSIMDITYAYINSPPDTPIITGPTNGKTGVKYDFNFSISDPDGDSMHIRIDWEYGTPGKWDGPFPSGSILKFNHSWTKKGTYTIRAQTMDSNLLLSNWGELQVNMPRTKTINSPFLNWLQSHPHMFPILQTLIMRFGL
jgi:PKD repeat protein